MTGWSLEFSREAEGDLAKLDRVLRRRIIDKLEWLAENFDSIFPLPLTGEFKEWSVFFLFLFYPNSKAMTAELG